MSQDFHIDQLKITFYRVIHLMQKNLWLIFVFIEIYALRKMLTLVLGDDFKYLKVASFFDKIQMINTFFDKINAFFFFF